MYLKLINEDNIIDNDIQKNNNLILKEYYEILSNYSLLNKNILHEVSKDKELKDYLSYFNINNNNITLDNFITGNNNFELTLVSEIRKCIYKINKYNNIINKLITKKNYFIKTERYNSNNISNYSYIIINIDSITNYSNINIKLKLIYEHNIIKIKKYNYNPYILLFNK